MMKIIIISVLIGVSLCSDEPYDVYKLKDCPGNNIDEGEYDTVLQCLEKCDKLSNCVAVIRDTTDNKCVFKRTCDLDRLQDSTASCMLYAKITRVYEVRTGQDCPGNEIIPLNVDDVAICITTCNSDPACVGFFRSNKGKCSLKNACNGKERSTDGNLYLNNLGQFQYLPEADCLSKNIKNETTLDNPGLCIKECVKTKGCMAVEYHNEDNKCMVKGECRNITRINRQHDVYISPDSGNLAALTSDSLPTVTDSLPTVTDSLPTVTDSLPTVTDTVTVDCESVGGHCRVKRCDKTGEKRCLIQAKCGTGKVCCCRDQCTTKGGVCKKKVRQCKSDEVACGQCEKGKVCCCKRVDPTPGPTCDSIGGTCVAKSSSCVQDCPKETCMPKEKCCCRVVAVRELLWKCDFENTVNDQMCDMEQSTNDHFDWTLLNGPTDSTGTGPSRAINGTYYIYTEASRPRVQGDMAIIYSPPITEYTGQACIQFYRHMYGRTMGSLSVHIKRIGQSGVSLRTIDGDDSVMWKEIRITVDIQENDQIMFRGVIGSGAESDIALDNIRVTSLPCEA